MLIIRKYKRLGWFELLEKIEEELKAGPEKKQFFEFLDELRMRLIESVSEGASFKLKAPAKKLLLEFQECVKKDPSFATSKDLEEFQELAASIL